LVSLLSFILSLHAHCQTFIDKPHCTLPQILTPY